MKKKPWFMYIKIYIYVAVLATLSIGSFITIIAQPFYRSLSKRSIAIMYIKKPKSFNWISQPLPEHKAIYSSSLNGLIVDRDPTFDNLDSLNKSILTFSPSSYLKVLVGNKKYNVRNEADARYMSRLLSNYRDYSNKDYSFLGLKALKLNNKIYKNFALSQASKIKVFGKGTYLDVDKNISNPNGKTFVISLKNDLKWDDGEPLVIDDFLERIRLHIDNNELFINTKEKLLKKSIQFENRIVALAKMLNKSLLQKNILRKLDDLDIQKSNLLASINQYASTLPAQKNDALYQKMVIRLNYFYDKCKDLLDIYTSFIWIYETYKDLINDGMVDNYNISNTNKIMYEKVLQNVIYKYEKLFSSLSLKLQNINILIGKAKNSINQIVLTKANIPSYKYSFQLCLNNIKNLAELFPLKNETFTDLLNLIYTSSIDLKNIKTAAIEKILLKDSLNIPLKHDFSKSQNFVKQLGLPTSLVSTIKSTNNKLVIKKDWDVISGNDITNYCLLSARDRREKINFDKYNLHFFTFDGDVKFSSINDLCNNYTLVYKKNNNLVFRLAKDMKIEDFFKLLTSPSMYPVKNKVFKNLSKNDQFKKLINYGDTKDDYMANGAFSIKSINYDGITFKKNPNFWDAKSVPLKEFVLKYINDSPKSYLNDLTSINSNKLISNNTKNYFLKHYQNNNFYFQRIRNGSYNLIFDIYNPTFTNNYFNTKIGSEIDWFKNGTMRKVNNYMIGKENECIINNEGHIYPEKTYDNYLCGIIPEYREFASAIRVFLLSVFDSDKFKNLENLSLLHKKETFIPLDQFEGELGKDYLDYTQEAVSYQNSTILDLNNLTYNNTLVGISLTTGRKIEKKVARSTLAHSFGIQNINGHDNTYSLNRGFYPTFKTVQRNSVEKNDPFDISESYLKSLNYAKKLWKSIVENAPSHWIKNLAINLNFSNDNSDKFKFALEQSWIKNIKQIVGDHIVFNKNVSSLYNLVHINPTTLSLKNYFTQLNEHLKVLSLDLDSIPRHVWKYFFINIKQMIEKNATLLAAEKLKLGLELQKIEEDLLDYKKGYFMKFTKYLDSNEYQNQTKLFKAYLFSQIEAFYLREAFIQPLFGSREGYAKININAPLIYNQYYDMTYAYFCDKKGKILIKNRAKQDNTYISITPPSCEDSILLRILRRELKNA